MERGHPARERIRTDNGENRDKIAYPDPAAAPLGTDDEAGGHPAPRARDRDALPIRDRSFASDHPVTAEDNRAPVHIQPGWQLWGMMVGFMAAGAAILIILSFQTI